MRAAACGLAADLSRSDAFPGSASVCSRCPEEVGGVTDVLRSYESTRHLSWSANSFMVSVTDPGGAHGGVLGPLHVNST
ncbi:hypothetical protein GTW43_21010 [Streptomyces sp. SID5785]|nr:hypothetical protein [Streptomyces sp. SID5785]